MYEFLKMDVLYKTKKHNNEYAYSGINSISIDICYKKHT